jgi:hypothetical protein
VHVAEKFKKQSIDKLNVASSLFRETTKREMPISYTEGPSFFNHAEATKKARQVVTSFTESYLSQYSQPLSPSEC